MSEMDDFTNDPEWKAWVAGVHDDLVPKLRDSASVVSLVPDGETDVKFAVELGLAIMMDKPILAVVMPGRAVPPKLARVVDAVIEADLDTQAGRDAMGEFITRFTNGLPDDEP